MFKLLKLQRLESLLMKRWFSYFTNVYVYIDVFFHTSIKFFFIGGQKGQGNDCYE